MVERKKELKRRYHRKKKVRKLKLKLAGTTVEADRQMILGKILHLSPEWKPAPAATTGAPAAAAN